MYDRFYVTNKLLNCATFTRTFSDAKEKMFIFPNHMSVSLKISYSKKLLVIRKT